LGQEEEVKVADSYKTSRALDGVKILAFEQVLSGPFATCLLADMGAEVIKVERPGVGDVIRSWDSVVKGLSSGYVWLNRNKRSLTVDVKKEKGRAIFFSRTTRLGSRDAWASATRAYASSTRG
jgi:crotonobetainyl-CoA:carnitine CoA-transferase CaiB-like acyl-CoA transferase